MHDYAYHKGIVHIVHGLATSKAERERRKEWQHGLFHVHRHGKSE